MHSVMPYRQKVLLGDRNPVVLLRGERQSGQPFFAYIVLTIGQLTRLNSDMDAGNFVRLSDYGKVVLQGEGQPSEEQMQYMAEHYAFFDHTDPFADDAQDRIAA
ncbi:MAG: hypothetical protein ACPG80_00325 [Rickettsiales bacterium]